MTDYRMGPKGFDRGGPRAILRKSKDLTLDIADWCLASGSVERLRRIMIGNPVWNLRTVTFSILKDDVLKVKFDGMDLRISKGSYNVAIAKSVMVRVQQLILNRVVLTEPKVKESAVSIEPKDPVVTITADAVSRLTRSFKCRS